MTMYVQTLIKCENDEIVTMYVQTLIKASVEMTNSYKSVK